MPTVLGVDSSTQSTKVELRDADDGRLLAAGRADHPAVRPPRSEQEPDAWWDALVTAVRSAAIDRADAISIAGQQHGLVVLDEHDQVIRPAKLWNDTESAAVARELVDALGADIWATRTGSVPVASFTVTKLAWLAAHERGHAERVARVLLPHDYLTWRLTGRFVTDRGDASGTGYFSPATGTWLPDLLELADGHRSADGWRACLPQLLGPTEPAGRLSRAAQSALGLTGASEVVVGPGTGDNMAAALGTSLTTGDVSISLGTSGTVYAVAEQPTADATGAVAGFCDGSGRFLPLVCVLNATETVDAFARLLDLDRARFAQLALDAPAGAGGVVLVPYLNGERTPNRPDASGSLFGLRTDTEPAQIARAAHEGVICGLLDGLDALNDAGVDTSAGRLLLIGGGARSSAFRQILADLTGRSVTIPAGDEHVARGACIQAAAVLAQTSTEAVARRWRPDDELTVDPTEGFDPAPLRGAYAAARDASPNGW